MRKIISVTIVGVMMLTLLIGLFGGLVEEGGGTITYDPLTNTIYVDGPDNDLIDIAINTSDSVFRYDLFLNSYISNASIYINLNSDLTIKSNDKLRFDGYYNITVQGKLFITGSSTNPAEIRSNKTSPQRGAWEGIKFISGEASESILNNTNIYNATIGIYCHYSSPTIKNSKIASNSKYGFYIVGSTPKIISNIIYNNGASGIEAGLYLEESSFIIENTTLNNPLSDIVLTSNSQLVSLNSVFNEGKAILFPSTTLIVKWYLNVSIIDADPPGLAISGANVRVRDNENGNFDENHSTGLDGWVRGVMIVEYIQTSSSKVYYNPYNISVKASDYKPNYKIVSITRNQNQSIEIRLERLDVDLVVKENEISFDNNNPIAGEKIHIDVIVRNIGNDDTAGTEELVKISFYDNDTTHMIMKELTPAILIDSIKGNSYEEVSEIWTTTPGEHVIKVWVDPNDAINETNASDPFQLNNWAEKYIFVNILPIININDPMEGVEVKDWIFINGTAFDSADDGNSNNVTHVELSLDNLESWEIIPPNGSFLPNTDGGYDWSFLWDTNQWNGKPISDGPHTIKARAFDQNHSSLIATVNVTVNNTEPNEPPVAIINEPLNNSHFSANQTIKFNGSQSYDPDNDELTYEWDFDDGTFGTGNITYHSFNQKGTYNVNLTVDDSRLQNFAYVTVIIDNYPPYAEITASTISGYVNQSITFFGYNSSDVETPVLTFFWDYSNRTDTNGDGNYTNDIDNMTISPVENTTHSYKQPGTYIVTLTVWDGIINSTDSVLITILSNAQPTAVISEPNEFEIFNVNETITFNASGSVDPNDETLEYSWNFGDGANTTWSTNPYANHTYSRVGTGIYPFLYFTVTLYVRDNEGLTDTDSIIINVNNYPPVAIALPNVTTAPTNQSIEFDGSDCYDPPPGSSPMTYLWNFDDGSTQFGQIVEHEFTANRVYNVTLTVTDMEGANDTDWIIINITNRNPIIQSVTYYPGSPTIQDQIYINITAYDPDGVIMNYTWDFGDGESYYETYGDVGFDGKTTHSYAEKDSYVVIVGVTDDDGSFSTTFFSIEITNIPPEIEITDPQDDETVQEMVTITGTASDMDDEKVSYVEIRIDNSNWFQPQDTSSDSSWSTWRYDWDTEFGPYKVTNGMHNIYARSFDGTSYSDSWAQVSVDVDNVPSDILITEILDKTTVEAGGRIDVSGQVTYNTGDPVDGIEVKIDIITLDIFWIAETSSSGHYTMNITAPEEAGTWFVRVTAEEGSFSDSKSVKINVTIILQSDLGISTADIDFNPSTPDTGDNVIITITVWNYGSEDADDVLVSVYDGDPDNQGIQIGSKTINVVKKEDKEEIEIEWDTEGEHGLHYIYVRVDPADDINESDENNNEAQRAIDIQGQPDFAVGGISFSAEEPKVGDTVTIQITIYNNGTESDTVKYQVFDGDPGVGVLIGEGNKQISAGRSSTVSVDWVPDEGGEHTIFVVLDPDDDITESDEDNNEGYRIITVQTEPGQGGIPAWLIPLTAIIAVIVIILLIMINYRGKKGKPEKELPVAEVVKQETKTKAQEPAKEKDEEEESLIDTRGGIRIG